MLIIDDFSKNIVTEEEEANILVLTHAHIDHLGHMSRKNVGGNFVHCSHVTFHLLCEKYSFLKPTFKRMNVVYNLQAGISVIPIDNNHAPGSIALYHIEKRVLYWGDGRFEKHEKLHDIICPRVIFYDGTFVRKKFMQPSVEKSKSLVHKFLKSTKSPSVYIKHFGQIAFLKTLEEEFYFVPHFNDEEEEKEKDVKTRVCSASLIKKSVALFGTNNTKGKKHVVVTCKKTKNCLLISALWFVIHEEVPKDMIVRDNENSVFRVYVSSHASHEDLLNMRHQFKNTELIDATKNSTHEIMTK